MSDEDQQPCDDCGDTEVKICPYSWLCEDCEPEPCGDQCEWAVRRADTPDYRHEPEGA